MINLTQFQIEHQQLVSQVLFGPRVHWCLPRFIREGTVPSCLLSIVTIAVIFEEFADVWSPVVVSIIVGCLSILGLVSLKLRISYYIFNRDS